MTTVRATIGPDAIELGRKRHRGKCAIAYAIAKEYTDFRHINVDRREIRFSDVYTRQRFCYSTTPELTQFIDSWDAGNLPEEPPMIRLQAKNLKWVKPMAERTAKDLVGATPNPGYESPAKFESPVKVPRPAKPGNRNVTVRELVRQVA